MRGPVGTMWEGLLPWERPAQGCSPLPFLSLDELREVAAKAWRQVYAAAASLPARSGEAASTDSLSAAAAPQQIAAKSTGFDVGFSDLRRCSTADQSHLWDFGDFPDGH